MTAKIRSMIERFTDKYFYREEEIDIEQAQRILEEARSKIKISMRERELLEVMAHTISGCVWIKNFDIVTEQHTYEFANLTLCEKFLCLDESCLNDCTSHVKGRTDFDLINDFMERCKKQHTFADICDETDQHAVENAVRYYHTSGRSGAKSSRYLESGIVGDKVILFNVVKTPLFREGEKPCWNTHTYIVGNATEVKICCDSVYLMGKDLVKSGKAEQICPGAIYIRPEFEEGECSLLASDLKEEK